MKNLLKMATVAAFIALTSPPISFAQGVSQTIATLDVKALETGYRGSKIIGSDVVNEQNDKIGVIDDLLITRDDRHLYAVISVGGFLGVGSKRVAIPYEQLKSTTDNKDFVLVGATEDSLEALPEYKYAD